MWLLIPSESARPARSVGGLRRGASSRQPGGEPERGANGGRGGGAPARPHALARDGADQAGPEPVVLEDAPGPAHVDWRSKRQGPHGVADVFGELRLARAGDHARGAVAAAGPRGDDESGNIATAPAPALPDRPEQRREPSEIPVSRRDDGPDAALATRGRHTHPRAPNVHAYAEGKRAS